MAEKLNDEQIEILNEIIEAVSIKKAPPNVSKFQDISRRSIKLASIYQDSVSVTLAIVAYSLKKIVVKASAETCCDFFPRLLFLFREIIESIDKESGEEVRNKLNEVLSIVSEADGEFKLHIGDVITRAKIFKGSRMYSHGISLAQTAEIMGLTQWELINYIGTTHIVHEDIEIQNVLDRVKFAKKLFNM